MLLPLSLHYINTIFSTFNIYVSHLVISLFQILTLVTFTHYRLLKKQGLDNCTTILTFKHHQVNSQEWLTLTRIHMLKHCISRLHVQKVQLKLSTLMKKMIQSFVNQTSSIVQARSSDVNFLSIAPSTKQE